MSVGYFTLVEGCRPLRLMVVWELRDKGRDGQKACLGDSFVEFREEH